MFQINLSQNYSLNRFGWNAALLCGMASVGGGSFFGTLITNLGLWWSMSQGMSINEAYNALGNGITSPTNVLSFISKAAFCFYGGYASAKYGKGHPLLQSAAVGVISVMFYFVMIFGPLSQHGSLGNVLLSLITPVVSSLLGGLLYARRGI